MKESAVKEIVSEFLGFLKHKVDHDALTMSDVKALARAIMEGLPVSGTIQDFAEYYGKTESSVRHIINRRVLEKPKRRVSYSFRAFHRAVPSSWLHEKSSKKTDKQ